MSGCRCVTPGCGHPPARCPRAAGTDVRMLSGVLGESKSFVFCAACAAGAAARWPGQVQVGDGPVQVDTSSRRWVTALHEAGHVSAARAFDWRVTAVRVFGDGSGGTWDTPPMLRERRRRERENALIHLAGPVVHELQLGVTIDADGDYGSRGATTRALDRAGIPPGCESDVGHAHRLLGWDADAFGEALAAARMVVRRKWVEIERVARVLYARGELDGRAVRKVVAW